MAKATQPTGGSSSGTRHSAMPDTFTASAAAAEPAAPAAPLQPDAAPQAAAPARAMPLPPPSGPNPGRVNGAAPHPAHTASSQVNGRTGPAGASAASNAAAPTGADAKSAMQQDSGSDDDGAIPAADFIARAKAKRLQLRHAHIAPDYIPSESAAFQRVKDFKKAEDAVKKGSGSDESDDGAEAADDARIKFGANGARSSRSSGPA